MGYCHYWTLKEELTEKEMLQFCDVVSHIVEKTNVKICGGLGSGTPKITIEEVSFNGADDLGESHESFWLMPNNVGISKSCKTNGKPYDSVVVAVLLALRHVAGDKVIIDSDGGPDDWMDGAILYRHVRGMTLTEVSRFVELTLKNSGLPLNDWEV